MLVPLGADGCLVFVGCDLNLTGGGTTVRIVLHFSIVYFFSLALLWGGQRYPPSAALECYDVPGLNWKQDLYIIKLILE
jgi:hypothetical protein